MDARHRRGMTQPHPASTEKIPLARLEALVLAPAAAAAPFPFLGGTVHLVSDVTEFGRLLRATRPAVVVVFAPPGTAAEIEIVARFRRRRSDVRAVLIDRPHDSAERLAALRAGFDEALDNAVAAGELRGRLALLAERARSEHSDSRLSLGGGAMLDVEARELRVRGRPVHLRPREAALLEVFCRNPGRTLTREALLDSVGAGPSLSAVRTIDVHVRWLREKLEAEGVTATRLVTVRGVGYRLQRTRSSARATVNRTLTERERDVDAPAED